MNVPVQWRAFTGEVAQQRGKRDHRGVVRAKHRRGDGDFDARAVACLLERLTQGLIETDTA